MAISLTSMIAQLPKPSSMSFSYPKDWGAEETGLFGALADGNTAGAVKSGVLGAASVATPGSAQAAAQAKYGLSLNKRNKAIFRDLPFREISLAWTLRPRNLTMAKTFIDIIHEMKILSAPVLVQDGSLWDTSEAIWSLEIRTTAAAPADIIFKANEMVMKDLSVNYTPNGFWSQHKDGYPTQIELSVAMMEVELAHQAKLSSKEII